MRARFVVSAIALIIAATASPAVAAGSSFGAAISPSPMIVENWRKPAFSIENNGTVPIVIDVELTGDSAYALATRHVTLDPRQTTTIPVTSVGSGEATVRFRVSGGAEGFDRQSVVLETTVRHRTLLESAPWPLLSVVALAVLLVALFGVSVWRRRRLHSVSR